MSGMSDCSSMLLFYSWDTDIRTYLPTSSHTHAMDLDNRGCRYGSPLLFTRCICTLLATASDGSMIHLLFT